MLELLDLPEYLSKHNNKIENAKMLCVLDRQVRMPEYLARISGANSSNIAALVNIIGAEIESRKYLIKGKVLVILGPRAFEPTNYGNRVLLLTGAFVSRPLSQNYVEMTMIYNRGASEVLYATKTLYRDIPSIRNAYPDLMSAVDTIARDNWDIDNYFLNHGLSYGYRECCSDYVFEELEERERFVYRDEEEYRRMTFDNINRQSSQEIQNEETENVVDYTKIQSVENRSDILKPPENLKIFADLLSKSNEKVQQNLTKVGMFNTVGVDEIDEKKDYLYNALKTYWNRSPSYDGATGRAIFKNVLEYLYPEFKNRYVKNKTIIDDAIDNHKALDIWYTGEIPESLKDKYFYYLISQLQEGLYIGFIDYLLGCKKYLFDSYNYSQGLEVNFFAILEKNPYYLCLIDNRLNVELLDKLAMLYQVDLKNPEVIKFRNAAYLHNFMLDSSNSTVEENTIILRENLLKNIYSGYQISSKSHSYLKTLGYIISNKVLENLKTYVDADINSSFFVLPVDGWREKKVKGASKFFLNLKDKQDSNDVLQDYIDSGLGVVTSIGNKNYVMDYTYLSKELYIIKRLYELQINGYKPSLESDLVDKCIRAFERQKGIEWKMPDFKLEDKQVEAVKLLYNPVLCVTGPAGSGKTTTAEALLFGLQALLGVEENEIMFCAPTGKAASRLKEIVKKPTRTINSLFGIGNESFTLLKEDKKKRADIKVLVVDESSMINLELMYNMISKLSDNTRIIFLGDSEQLPPIGAGKPFKNMLSYLPCVVLNVLKRASENSGISRNASSLIYESEKMSPPELKSYDDFRILEVPKSKIQDLVVGIVNYHLGRAGEKRVGNTTAAQRVLQSLDVDLIPEEIQIITPVNKYEWGTRELNLKLQEVINPKKAIEYSIRFETNFEYSVDEYGNTVRKSVYTEFRKNDRVIHLENMAMKDRYIKVNNQTFQKIKTTGVMNGDVGTVIGFIKGCDLKFVLENGDEDTETKESFSDSETVLYTVVSYKDVDENAMPLDYIIFYKADILESTDFDELLKNQYIYTLESVELRKLDLAYALTVHKMQGSQSKLVVFVVYPVGYNTFISRNLLYTGITRAEKGIYLVGNVTGWNNIISSGRKVEQNSLRVTISDKIFVKE